MTGKENYGNRSEFSIRVSVIVGDSTKISDFIHIYKYCMEAK
jgi:hypothetical protein